MITNWVKNESNQYRGYIIFLKDTKEEDEPTYYDYFMSFFF